MKNEDKRQETGGAARCRVPRLASAVIFALPFVSAPLCADPIPWKLPSYTLVARDMDLGMALDTFAVAEGLSVVKSPSVGGVFSGDFRNVKPDDFLDRIAKTHNLIWYYDGAALYIYGAGEIATMLIDLQYMKAGEVRAMLAELGVEDARFPLKTTSNDELVMVSGPPRYVSLVAEMVAKADKLRERRAFTEVEARIFPLVHTWADNINFKANSPESTLTIRGVARLLDEIVNGDSGHKIVDKVAGDGDGSDPAVLPASSFKPVIRPENRLNAVIVRDVSTRMPMYEKLIKELDVPQRLVEIDITVVELTRKDALDWQLSLSLETSRGHSKYGAGQNAANLFSPEAIAGKGLAGALTHIHSSYSLAASIAALREKGKARSISRTSLLTVNNLAAEMSDIQSYHARVVGTEVATLEEVSAGTKLQIKPRILPSAATNVPNQVWLSMELDDGGFEAITVDAMPVTRSSVLQTQTAVFENESIMLAGYLRDIEEDAGWGIPWLRDLPLIGWIFGGKSTRKETVQRMFVMTPHIVDIDQDMLARAQATTLRDVTLGDDLEDDAEVGYLDRERRRLERKNNTERRREKAEDEMERRKAEIDHDWEMRQIDRKRKRRYLSEDMRRWAEEEAAERKKFETEGYPVPKDGSEDEEAVRPAAVGRPEDEEGGDAAQ